MPKNRNREAIEMTDRHQKKKGQIKSKVMDQRKRQHVCGKHYTNVIIRNKKSKQIKHRICTL